MRKALALALFTILAVFSLGTAHAALIDNGGGLIYDTDLDITWYDAPRSIGFVTPDIRDFDWYTATAWAASLTLGGTTAGSWRLPTTPGTDYGYTDEGEMGHLYYIELGNTAGGPLANTGPFVNLGATLAYFYWSSTEHAEPGAFDDGAWGLFFADGYQSAAPKDTDDIYALAVHSGNIGPNGPINPVPAPGAILLFAPGLSTLVIIRRRFKS